MANIKTRSGKGSPLTNDEVDSNFNNLNSDKVEKATTVSAGSGLSGGGDLSGDVTLSHADTSSVSSVNNSGNTFVQDLVFDTYGHVTGTTSGTVVVGDGAMSVNAGTDLVGGGQVGTANQSTASSVTVNHADISRSNSTSSTSPAHGGTFTAIDSVSTNARGHVTGTNTKTVTLPAQYVHPTYAGDDINVDTGPLTGAKVVSDIDFNVTTDTQGHVTDANGSVVTRNLTLADLGFTGASNANYYVHPSYAGDDINLDTGALSGAKVISDLDFNVTTDTLGHVTDANATVATRNLTASDIGALPVAGKAADSDKLDGLSAEKYVRTLASYNTTSSVGRLMVKLPYLTTSAKMLSFDIDMYTSYVRTKISISGYLYASINNWYSPTATIESTGTAVAVTMGRTSDGYAYVSIPVAAYTGIKVSNLTVGHAGSTSDYLLDGWQIIDTDEVPNTVSVSTRTVFHDGYHPNADKWTTARTLSLTGDVSGSTSWDGSGNASIAVTVADDSHNHTIANVDGLQTALNGKQAAGTYNTVIGTDSDLNTSGSTIIDNIYVTDGVITSMGTRTLTASDIGAAASSHTHSGYLATTGGTVTGTITGTTFKSNATSENARATGYKIANGVDIGECNRSTQYYDDLVSNCNGYLPTGNCLGNSTWIPPNGNWWTWGASGVPTSNCANWGSYDGAGGTSSTFYAVTVGYNYDAYYEAANEIGGSEQRRNYKNCNCGSFNCRTNCNCNCNCDCY
jgi:hypothetical protein